MRREKEGGVKREGALSKLWELENCCRKFCQYRGKELGEEKRGAYRERKGLEDKGGG